MGARLSNHSKSPPPDSRDTSPYSTESVVVPLGKKGDLCCPNGVAISEEFVFIADGGTVGTARVSVFSKSGEFVTSFSNDYMQCPWSIAVHRDNVYLTDTYTHSLLQFGEDEGFSFSRRVGGMGSGDTEFNCPTQVSVSNSGEVYVADKLNERIQILNSQLKYLRSITHPTLIAPIGVRVMGEGVYVLSVSDSYLIHLFSVTGDKTSYRLPSSSVSRNASFLLDARNNIILSSDQIEVFSRGGKLLQEVTRGGGGGGGGDEGGEDYTMGTVLTQDKIIGIVALDNKYGLQIVSRSILHKT